MICERVWGYFPDPAGTLKKQIPITFTDSQTIDREPLIYTVASGASLLTCRQHLEISYTHVYQSKEFAGQPLAHVYGAVTLSYYW